MLLKKKRKKKDEDEINILISSRAHNANSFKINQQISNIFIKQ